MAHLSLYLLGPFQATLDGVPIVGFESNKVRALLAYLAVEAHRRPGEHSRQALAGLLWPDKPERAALANLRNALSNLRKAIGDRDASPPFLQITRETIQFNVASDHWLDVAAFSAAFQEQIPTAADGPTYQQLLEAVALYRGDLLEGFYVRDSLEFEEWVLLLRERLHGQALEALATLAAYHEERGAYREAIRCARQQVALEPWNERGHRQLMRVLALSGEHAAALVQYDACRQVLAQELGIEPGTATTALYERIREGEALLPSLSSSSPGNLPVQPTRFVGRERELAELTGLLTDRSVRVVTVVGAGGMGKTRLALQVAAASSARYPAGAWLAELATAVEDEAVPRAVATALGVREQANLSLPETIAVSLQTRELLLILDNCEHVVEGAAGLVSLLVGRCPQLTVLATSREPLRVPGEHLYEVPPLTLPSPDAALDVLLDADAVQLFAERATAVRPGYTLDGERAARAARICRRLDGMPLAIELAAARLRALSLAEVAQRLGDRFGLLTGGGRTALPRQRTLRNTVGWSYELLSEAERLMFDRLSIFPGSFDLAAAQAVCAGDRITAETVLDLLAGLVDRSLVTARVTAEGTTRYRLLETLRQYGEERLTERGERDDVAARHTRCYVALAEAQELDLESWGETMLPALKRLDAEAENLRAAMRWSLAHGEPDLALRLGGAARWWVYYGANASHSRQYVEWLESALASGKKVELCYQVKALGTIGLCALSLGQFDKFRAAWKEELVLAQKIEEPALIARALCGAGLYPSQIRLERTPAHLREGVQIARDRCFPAAAKWAQFHLALLESLERGQKLLEELLAQAPNGAIDHYLARYLGLISGGLGDLEEAEVPLWLSAEGFGEWRMVGEQAYTWNSLADVAAKRGDYARAARLLEQSKDLCRRSGLIAILAWTVHRMGKLAWQCGDQDASARYNAESLALTREQAIERHETSCLIGLALAACERGEYERAERLCAQARERLDGTSPVSEHVFLPSTLARVALHRGQTTRAVELCRGLVGFQRLEAGRPHLVESLETLAWALAADGQHGLGTQLLACTERERAEMGLVRYPVDRPYQDRALAAVRAGLSAAAFDAAWVQGEALSLKAAVAAAMGTMHE